MSFTLHRGKTPLLISLPHVGTEIPADQRGRTTARALQVEDTDWYLDRLYDFARDLGVGMIVPAYSRYLIDLNRPRENAPMYPGANNTELCPTRHFTSDPIYRAGQAPDAGEIARRIDHYWQPYHDTLHTELQRLKATHGHALLFDGHSIKSRLPWLFDGELPHLNLGTADGASCDPSLRDTVAGLLRAQDRYELVVDGRFKGGHITRTYGRPADGVHALQLEMCWRCYMEEEPPAWNDERAAEVTPLLHQLVTTLRDWRPA